MSKFINNIKSNKLITDSAWSLAGNLVGKGLALLAGILVARILGKDVYGEYGIIRNTILTIGIFSTFGLGYTATKFIADFKNHKPEKIKIFIKYANQITLVFSGFMAVFLFLFADKVAIDVLKIQDLGYALRLLAVLIVFNAITTTQIGIIAGFGKFKKLAKINSVIGILTFILSVGLTYYYSFEGSLLALVLVQIINCILNFFVVTKALPEEVVYDQRDTQLFKNILNFSFPIAFREAIYFATSWGLNLFVIKHSSIGEYGLYAVAMQWNAVILFIPGIMKNIVLSHLSSTTSVSENLNILNKILIINLFSVLIPSFLVFMLSNIIESFYGVTFIGLGKLIAVAVLITIFSSLSGVYTNAFISLNKNWIVLYSTIFREIGIFLLGFLFIVLKIFNGAFSIVLASLLMNVIYLFFSFFCYRRVIKKLIY